MHPHPRRSGFTLIELLTVIAIIAILMGLLFPAIIAAKNTARKAQARNDMSQFVTAIKSFNTDYGTYPINPTVQKDTEYGVSGVSPSNSALINTLISDGSEPSDPNNQFALNPRQVVYLDVPSVKDTSNPKSGLTRDTTSGNFPKHEWIDPWGNAYVVGIDADYDNFVTVTKLKYSDLQYDTPSSGGGGSAVHTGVIAASVGADHVYGSAKNPNVYANSDDVLSWQ